MQEPPPDPVEALLGRLLREPEAHREPAVERALARLKAARGDAAYLLMHRVLVLETALARLQPTPQGAAQGAPRSSASARSFVRDAAVVATGVLAGTWLAQGVASTASHGAQAGEALGDASTDLALDDDGLDLF
jgi:hypothetical protein